MTASFHPGRDAAELFDRGERGRPYYTTDKQFPSTVFSVLSREFVRSLPVLRLREDRDYGLYLDKIHPDEMPGPVCKGVDGLCRPFFAFRFRAAENGSEPEELVVGGHRVTVVFQRWSDNMWVWQVGGDSFPGVAGRSSYFWHTDEEKKRCGKESSLFDIVSMYQSFAMQGDRSEFIMNYCTLQDVSVESLERAEQDRMACGFKRDDAVAFVQRSFFHKILIEK